MAVIWLAAWVLALVTGWMIFIGYLRIKALQNIEKRRDQLQRIIPAPSLGLGGDLPGDADGPDWAESEREALAATRRSHRRQKMWGL